MASIKGWNIKFWYFINNYILLNFSFKMIALCFPGCMKPLVIFFIAKACSLMTVTETYDIHRILTLYDSIICTVIFTIHINVQINILLNILLLFILTYYLHSNFQQLVGWIIRILLIKIIDEENIDSCLIAWKLLLNLHD